MNTTDLTNTPCLACNGDVPLLSELEVQTQMAALDENWQLTASNTTIKRKYNVKGFAKAVYLANLAAFLADREGHHPDLEFGWGYCTVSFTTHDAGGLTMNDFICAQKLDTLTQA